jgi:hypothetical protein
MIRAKDGSTSARRLGENPFAVVAAVTVMVINHVLEAKQGACEAGETIGSGGMGRPRESDGRLSAVDLIGRASYANFGKASDTAAALGQAPRGR